MIAVSLTHAKEVKCFAIKIENLKKVRISLAHYSNFQDCIKTPNPDPAQWKKYTKCKTYNRIPLSW